jgi:hypothetical protein
MVSKLSRGQRALGTMVGASEDINYVCDMRTKSIWAALEQDATNLDDRCMKNYALLISLPQKVLGLLFTHRPGHLASSPCKSVTKTADYYTIVFVKYFLFLAIFIPETWSVCPAQSPVRINYCIIMPFLAPQAAHGRVKHTRNLSISIQLARSHHWDTW